MEGAGAAGILPEVGGAPIISGFPVLPDAAEKMEVVQLSDCNSERGGHCVTNILVHDDAQKWYVRVDGASVAPVLDSVPEEMTSGRAVNRILRSETVSINGKSHECWVVESDSVGAVVSMAGQNVEATVDGTETIWIDKILLLKLLPEATYLITGPP